MIEHTIGTWFVCRVWQVQICVYDWDGRLFDHFLTGERRELYMTYYIGDIGFS